MGQAEYEQDTFQKEAEGRAVVRCARMGGMGEVLTRPTARVAVLES